ncbi:unnamed protein product [Vitrella brassicaformis CCMP3155]|uniref:Uncharacterized protein n=2 Tax=Vitrella brassicaformis TaxID=1169539 RepID=A0A0G4EZQ1_VITBC|nr:unnamed protein product [Vitrella brassicaformis CCMP3155]|eukprot:CEM04303.1 unnamed protein product [Vitrella brassicaformis CCMP3155]
MKAPLASRAVRRMAIIFLGCADLGAPRPPAIGELAGYLICGVRSEIYCQFRMTSGALGSFLKKVKEGADKVKDTVKEGVQQARDALRVVKSHLSVTELERQLETQARQPYSLPIHAEEFKRLSAQILSSGREGSTRYHDADHTGQDLSFKQVFLRCQALPITLTTLARQNDVKKHLMGKPDEGESGTPRVYFHQLLSLCFKAPASLFVPLVDAILSTDPSHTMQFQKLLGLLSLYKYDWEDEHHQEERRDLAIRTEQLKHAIHQMSVPPSGATLQEKDDSFIDTACQTHARRVKASAELVATYKTLMHSLQQSSVRRKDVTDQTATQLTHLRTAVEHHISQLSDNAHSTVDRKAALQTEMEKASEGLAHTLRGLDEERLEIDSQLETLEEKKKALKLQLEDVTQQIVNLTDKQRQHMHRTDSVRHQLSTLRKRFEGKMDTEEQLRHESIQEQEATEQLQKLAGAAQVDLVKVNEQMSSDIAGKASNFKSMVEDVIRRHLQYQMARITHQGEVLQRYVDMVKDREKSAATMAAVGVEQRPIDAVDFDLRHRLAKAIAQLELIWDDVMQFQQEHSTLIQQLPATAAAAAAADGEDQQPPGQAPITLSTLKTEYQKLVRLAAPFMEELQNSAPSPISPVLPPPPPPPPLSDDHHTDQHQGVIPAIAISTESNDDESGREDTLQKEGQGGGGGGGDFASTFAIGSEGRDD